MLAPARFRLSQTVRPQLKTDAQSLWQLQRTARP